MEKKRKAADEFENKKSVTTAEPTTSPPQSKKIKIEPSSSDSETEFLNKLLLCESRDFIKKEDMKIEKAIDDNDKEIIYLSDDEFENEMSYTTLEDHDTMPTQAFGQNKQKRHYLKWTEEQNSHLLAGLLIFGRDFQAILNQFRNVFGDIEVVNLQTQYYNLVKYPEKLVKLKEKVKKIENKYQLSKL